MKPWAITLIIIGSIILVFLFYIVILAPLLSRLFPSRSPSWIPEVIDNPFRRNIFQKPKTIIQRMAVAPGMTCMDIGAGKGFYTKELAKQAAPGIVHAIDISEKVIERLDRRVKKWTITNIQTHVQNAQALDFPDNSVDRILSITCLPEIPEPIKALEEWKRVLKPGGIISLSEVYGDPDYPRRKTEKEWAKKAGLEFVEEFGNFFVYQLNFRKPQKE